MKNLCAALLAIGLALPHAFSGETKAPGSAKEALGAFWAAVHNQVVPRLETLDANALQQEIGDLALKHLTPHKALFAQEAQRKLRALPAFDLRDRSRYRPALAGGQKAMEEFRSLFALGIRGSHKGLLLATWWDPVKVATSCRMMAFARALGPAEMAKRAMVEQMAPSTVAIVKQDPTEPVLAIVTGPELVLVGLRYTDLGVYVPTQLQWLTRAPRADKPPAKR